MKRKSLREIQTLFSEVLLSAGTEGAARSRRHLERSVRATPAASSAKRVRIYREMFLARHRAAIATTFPDLAATLTPTALTELTAIYLAAQPPCADSLTESTKKLPQFLSRLKGKVRRRTGKIKSRRR